MKEISFECPRQMLRACVILLFSIRDEMWLVKLRFLWQLHVCDVICWWWDYQSLINRPGNANPWFLWSCARFYVHLPKVTRSRQLNLRSKRSIGWRRQGLCFGNFALLFVCEANGNFIQALASTDSRILRRGCKVLFRWKFCRREEQFIFKFWLFNSGETIEENLWNYTICLYLLVASVHHLIQEFFW